MRPILGRKIWHFHQLMYIPNNYKFLYMLKYKSHFNATFAICDAVNLFLLHIISKADLYLLGIDILANF